MAGNAGHPFYGNQHTAGNYAGGYKYEWLPNHKATEFIPRSTKPITNRVSSFSPNNVISQVFKATEKRNGGIITMAIAITAAVGTGAYFLSKHIHKKYKDKKEVIQADELAGTCTHCGELLNDSEYVSETESVSNEPYRICKNCKERNFV